MRPHGRPSLVRLSARPSVTSRVICPRPVRLPVRCPLSDDSFAACSLRTDVENLTMNEALKQIKGLSVTLIQSILMLLLGHHVHSISNQFADVAQ